MKEHWNLTNKKGTTCGSKLAESGSMLRLPGHFMAISIRNDISNHWIFGLPSFGQPAPCFVGVAGNMVKGFKLRGEAGISEVNLQSTFMGPMEVDPCH